MVSQCTDRSVIGRNNAVVEKIMLNAKRMVLVDVRLLDWKRPIEVEAKIILPNQLRNDLNGQTVPDDVKAKQYQHDLSRFLKTKNMIVPESIIKQEIERTKPVKRAAVSIAKKPKERNLEKTKAVRKSKRVPKKPFKWEP